jgi:TRAP-type C4-dicarboxylate transport system permease small subunit
MNLSVQHTLFILVGIFLLIVLTRYIRKKTFPNSEELTGLAFAVSGTFAAVQIIDRALFLTECQEFLGVEGVVALFGRRRLCLMAQLQRN